MTNIQVAYWDLQEKKRNNMANLEEAKRHNKETEALTRQRNDNDFVLGQGNLDLGRLNSDRNYELGKENAAIGWQNSQYNYQLGMDRNTETRTHNIVMEGLQANGAPDYILYGSQRGGDIFSGTVGQVGQVGQTAVDVYNSTGMNSLTSDYRNWMSNSDAKIGDWLSKAKDKVSNFFSDWGKSNRKVSSRTANNPLG